jgi:hypothetical protein
MRTAIPLLIVTALAGYFWQVTVAILALAIVMAVPVSFLAFCVRPGHGY